MISERIEVHSERIVEPYELGEKWTGMLASQEEFYEYATREAKTPSRRRNSHNTSLYSTFSVDEQERKDFEGNLIIYATSETYARRIVPSPADIYNILHNDHFSAFHGAASAGKRMYYRIRREYFIRRLSDMCYWFASTQCDACQQTLPKKKTVDRPRPITSLRPLGRIIIDTSPITGIVEDHAPHLVVSKDVHMVLAVDKYSGKMWGTLLPSRHAAPIAEWMLSLFLRESFPLIIQSDNGTEFKGSFELVVKYLEARRIRSKVRHPQTNGQVERMNLTVKNALRKVLAGEEFKNGGPLMTLEIALQMVICSINTTPNERNQRYTPHELFSGSAHSHSRHAIDEVEESERISTEIDEEERLGNYEDSVLNTQGIDMTPQQLMHKGNRERITKNSERIVNTMMQGLKSVSEGFEIGTIVSVKHINYAKIIAKGKKRELRDAWIFERMDRDYRLVWIDIGYDNEIKGQKSVLSYPRTLLSAQMNMNGQVKMIHPDQRIVLEDGLTAQRKVQRKSFSTSSSNRATT